MIIMMKKTTHAHVYNKFYVFVTRRKLYIMNK